VNNKKSYIVSIIYSTWK